MNKEIEANPRRTLGLTIIGLVACLAIPAAALLTTSGAGGQSQDCPNGPLAASLAGTAASGAQTPSGNARFREGGGNRLIVMVRSVTAGTSLDVFVGDVKVGAITVPRNGNGQLSVDSPAASIGVNTAITIRNGEAVILSGTFACVAAGGNTNSNSNMNSNTISNMNMESNMNMNSNMNTNVNSNSFSNMDVNSNANTNVNVDVNVNARPSPSPGSRS